MDREDITLTLPAAPRPKYVRLTVKGTELRRETWMGTGKPRHSRKQLYFDFSARTQLAKETARRMRQGYVEYRDPATVAAGQPYLVCSAPGPAGGYAFDLSPDGRMLAVAANTRPQGATIHLIDTTTGARRLVHATETGRDRVRIHDVRFDVGGQNLVYAGEGTVRRLDLGTGADRAIASYPVDPRLVYLTNVQLATDQARQRLLVVEPFGTVQVFGASDAPLIAVNTPRGEHWPLAALSPSGRLLAVANRRTQQVDVWDVDSGEQTSRLTFPLPPLERDAKDTCMERLGFHPDERRLLATRLIDEGPFAASIDTAQRLWESRNPNRPDHWNLCLTWGFTPDGKRLVLWETDETRRNARLRFLHPDTFTDADTPKPAPMPMVPRGERIVFSADGSRFACGVDNGRISVHAVT